MIIGRVFYLDWLLEGDLLAGVMRHLLALLVRDLDQSEVSIKVT